MDRGLPRAQAIMSEEHFQLFSTRKSKRRNISLLEIRSLRKPENVVVENLQRAVHEAVNEFRESPFRDVLFQNLAVSLQNLEAENFKEIICYGLGNFSLYQNSKYQLSALCTLKNDYQCQVKVYDPLFSDSEIHVLKLFGLEVIEENEEGKRRIDDGDVALIIMLHCPKQLLNNFLYANWGENLENCVFFCNSYSIILENSSEDEQNRSANYILKICQLSREISLNNNFRLAGTFSDCSLHYLDKDKMRGARGDFFESENNEPNYMDNIEFVRKNTPIS